jgi:hypothetical protein
MKMGLYEVLSAESEWGFSDKRGSPFRRQHCMPQPRTEAKVERNVLVSTLLLMITMLQKFITFQKVKLNEMGGLTSTAQQPDGLSAVG